MSRVFHKVRHPLGKTHLTIRLKGLELDRTIRASFFSIATDVVLTTLKGMLAFVTGSLALAADAIHSLSDLIVSVSVLTGIVLRRFRQEKPLFTVDKGVEEAQITNGNEENDANKGHWIEATIAAIVSLLILYMPVEIISEVRAKDSAELEHAWIGILGTLIIIAIIYFISRYKIIVGRETNSPALEADGYHSRMDMFTSMAVVLSLMGQMIGIQLDPIVAVIIAVLIAIAGLDLFVSSIVSLIKKQDVHELSVWDSFLEKMNQVLENNTDGIFGGESKLSLERIRHKLFNTKTILTSLIASICLYLASGFTVLKPWEAGVKLRFGEVIEAQLSSGLNYHLPYPFESIVRINMEQVQRVEIGFRNASSKSQQVNEEAIMVTGDEGIVDLQMVVHYQYSDTITHWMHVKNLPEMMRGLAESSAREELSIRSSDKVLSQERQDLMEDVRANLNRQVEQLQLGVEVLAVYVNSLHPPQDVVPTFKDVFSAKEDKARFLSEAQAYKNEALPEARGQYAQQIAEAESFALEQRLHAEGDAAKFKLVASSYATAPEITEYRLFIETMESGLSGREKIIADPSVNQGEYRHWLFAPGQAIDELKSKSAQTTRGMK